MGTDPLLYEERGAGSDGVSLHRVTKALCAAGMALGSIGLLMIHDYTRDPFSREPTNSLMFGFLSVGSAVVLALGSMIMALVGAFGTRRRSAMWTIALVNIITILGIIFFLFLIHRARVSIWR